MVVSGPLLLGPDVVCRCAEVVAADLSSTVGSGMPICSHATLSYPRTAVGGCDTSTTHR